jgi:hypothetical protein
MTKTPEDVTELYKSIGEAIWMLQHLEYAMTHFNAYSILQKQRDKGQKIGEKEAFFVLEKQRKLTLGPLIKAAKSLQILPLTLEAKFDRFLRERNWLIHRCVIDEYLSLENVSSKKALFKRIGKFTTDCIVLKKEVLNMMEGWHQDSGYSVEKAYEEAEKLIEKSKHDR